MNVREVLASLEIEPVNSGACGGEWIEHPSGGELESTNPADGSVTARLRTGKGAHNFWPKGDGRHWFLSNRIEGTVSLIDTQDMMVVNTIDSIISRISSCDRSGCR